MKAIMLPPPFLIFWKDNSITPYTVKSWDIGRLDFIFEMVCRQRDTSLLYKFLYLLLVAYTIPFLWSLKTHLTSNYHQMGQCCLIFQDQMHIPDGFLYFHKLVNNYVVNCMENAYVWKLMWRKSWISADLFTGNEKNSEDMSCAVNLSLCYLFYIILFSKSNTRNIRIYN